MSNVIGLSPEHESNLRKLADYLLSGVLPHTVFNMAIFESSGNPSNAATCGSVGCAVGHGPYAGVGFKKPNEDWEDYALRVFGLEGPAWNFCFSAMWASIDNTPESAAKRILYVLDNGVPESGIYTCHLLLFADVNESAKNYYHEQRKNKNSAW